MTFVNTTTAPRRTLSIGIAVWIEFKILAYRENDYIFEMVYKTLARLWPCIRIVNQKVMQSIACSVTIPWREQRQGRSIHLFSAYGLLVELSGIEPLASSLRIQRVKSDDKTSDDTK